MTEVISKEVFMLAVFMLPFLSILCLGAFIGDQVFNYQEKAANHCRYGLVRVGSELKPNDKKCKFNVIVRNILAKLRFN